MHSTTDQFVVTITSGPCCSPGCRSPHFRCKTPSLPPPNSRPLPLQLAGDLEGALACYEKALMNSSELRVARTNLAVRLRRCRRRRSHRNTQRTLARTCAGQFLRPVSRPAFSVSVSVSCPAGCPDRHRHPPQGPGPPADGHCFLRTRHQHLPAVRRRARGPECTHPHPLLTCPALCSVRRSQGAPPAVRPYHHRDYRTHTIHAAATFTVDVLHLFLERLSQPASTSPPNLVPTPPFIPRLLLRLLQALYNLGVAHAESGHPHRACAFYHMAVLLQPGCAEAWNNLGVISKGFDTLEQSIEYFTARGFAYRT